MNAPARGAALRLPLLLPLLVSMFLLAVFAPVGALHAQATAAPDDWAGLGKVVAGELVAKQFDRVEARYDAKMKSALPAGKLATIWEGLLGQVGAPRELGAARVDEVPSFHVVVVPCTFERAVLDFKLTFDGERRLAGLFFLPSQPKVDWTPPDYAKPSTFHERAVTVGSDPWKLPGTLTIPEGKGPFPALVLVHGSGPHDEDETIGPNRPFKDLAWGLASRGVAVLRYSKRTAAHGAELQLEAKLFTVQDETVDDAQAALALAAQQPEIDPARVYLLGHSLGGMLAPRIAKGNPALAGMVILAGTTRPLEVIVLEQLRYLAGLAGPAGSNADARKAQDDAVRDAEKSAAQIESKELAPGTMVNFVGATIPGSYFLDLRGYNPPEVAAKLKLPILVLQAERDYQVTLTDFDNWKKGLAKHPHATFKLYPGLYHLFLPSQAQGTSLATPADYEKPGHVVEPVIADIAAWIAGQPSQPRQKRLKP